ncbi:MAG: hypothetical protein JRF63_05120 [Deltaproteobacteria bacterium]|nr:hypothetical protein [Deltaproteobacteria bacterium]
MTLCVVAIAAASARTGSVAADACTDRCETSYQSCAAVEAAGCELGSDLVGAAATDFADQIAPGFGALFGGFSKQMSKEACLQALMPCEEIRSTCLAECTSHQPAQPADPAAAAAPPPPPVKYATFRVFSDHPRTIVYINDQRMGATPEDPLEPFVTPELRVGKYWVRMVTLDGRWEWVGAKDVEEGNINAVEGVLVNLEDRDWYAAVALEEQGASVPALRAFEAFVRTFSDSARIPDARQRIATLRVQIEAAEREMFGRIESESDLQQRLALCEAYITGFEHGYRSTEVRHISEATEAEIAAIEDEQASWQRITAAATPGARLIEGKHYLASFPSGPHRAEVEQIVAAARSEVDENEALRKPLVGAGIASMAVGGAALLGGGVAGIFALVKDGQLDDECQENGDCGTDLHDTVDQRDKLAVTSNVLMIAGGTLVVAGIVLWAVAPDEDEQAVVLLPSVGPSALGASVKVSF